MSGETVNPGPAETADDATKADMGMGGPPAQSATPVGEGASDDPGADEHARDDDMDESTD